MRATETHPARRHRGDAQRTCVLEWIGLAEDGERTTIRMLALDRDGTPLYREDIGRDGEFHLPEEVLHCAHRIVFGMPDAAAGIREQTAVRMRAGECRQRLRFGRLVITERCWSVSYWRAPDVAEPMQGCAREDCGGPQISARRSPATGRARSASSRSPPAGISRSIAHCWRDDR
jgi:hypothetical protein